MQSKEIEINGIPSIVWGGDSETVIIAVHGNQSNKKDTPIRIFSEEATASGYQLLSFDLPEHGERKTEDTPCKVQYCVADLIAVMQYAKARWKKIGLFSNSIGAYFSLLAYADEHLWKAWFLSPVLDMRRLIENMMDWFHVTETELQKEQAVCTPVGQTLYWDYYCYVKSHPVAKWNTPTYILYGAHDDLCEKETILDFVAKFPCDLQIAEHAEHYFNTPEELQALKAWIKKTL